MQFRLWTGIWKILFVRNIPDKKYRILGECEHDARIIRVLSSLRGKEKLDTLVHEMLHAVLPEQEELWVNSVASDIATVLWDYGYRNINENKKPAE